MKTNSETPPVAICDNCGEETPSPQDCAGSIMCPPCVEAEKAYARLHGILVDCRACGEETDDEHDPCDECEKHGSALRFEFTWEPEETGRPTHTWVLSMIDDDSDTPLAERSYDGEEYGDECGEERCAAEWQMLGRHRLANAPEPRHDVLCGCGWGRLAMRESEIPCECPVCESILPGRECNDEECQMRGRYPQHSVDEQYCDGDNERAKKRCVKCDALIEQPEVEGDERCFDCSERAHIDAFESAVEALCSYLRAIPEDEQGDHGTLLCLAGDLLRVVDSREGGE